MQPKDRVRMDLFKSIESALKIIDSDEELSYSVRVQIILGILAPSVGLVVGFVIAQVTGRFALSSLTLVVLLPILVFIVAQVTSLSARLGVRMTLVPSLVVVYILLLGTRLDPDPEITISSFLLRRHRDMAIEFVEAIFRARSTREGLSLKLQIFRLRKDILFTVMWLELHKALKKIGIS
jgi:hypothetical protein